MVAPLAAATPAVAAATLGGAAAESPAWARPSAPSGAIFDRVRSQPRIPAPHLEAGAERPAILRRMAAFAVDAAVVTLIGAVFLLAGAFAYGLQDLTIAGDGSALAGARALLEGVPGLAPACLLVLALVVSGYFIWFQATEGKTPGMALLDLRLVRRDGRPLGLSGALVRWASFWLAAAPFGLGLLWAAFSEEQLGVHDRLSGTRVRRG